MLPLLFLSFLWFSRVFSLFFFSFSPSKGKNLSLSFSASFLPTRLSLDLSCISFLSSLRKHVQGILSRSLFHSNRKIITRQKIENSEPQNRLRTQSGDPFSWMVDAVSLKKRCDSSDLGYVTSVKSVNLAPKELHGLYFLHECTLQHIYHN